jgi:UDP-N-acetyl-2-amino-2-deoxyglucuronate dehydrogenase
MLTAGCHALDALLMLMGHDVQSVTSLSTKSASPIFAPYEYDTSSVTILHFKNGAIGKTAAIVDCLQPYYSTRTSWAARAACSTTSFTR